MNFYGNRAIIRKKVDFGLILDPFLKINFEKKNFEKTKKTFVLDLMRSNL